MVCRQIRTTNEKSCVSAPSSSNSPGTAGMADWWIDPCPLTLTSLGRQGPMIPAAAQIYGGFLPITLHSQGHETVTRLSQEYHRSGENAEQPRTLSQRRWKHAQKAHWRIRLSSAASSRGFQPVRIPEAISTIDSSERVPLALHTRRSLPTKLARSIPNIKCLAKLFQNRCQGGEVSFLARWYWDGSLVIPYPNSGRS